ncbi:hypothetical protein BDQ12DRAFT_664996 [Crucibulum laeve]|uniref:Malate dehydrogenase n=1 Tax=Crucibulum laeve TaxID=68775 RepID=A0A5C3M7E3_9AGAR|nr:hypothetical protein BDQ12DRAFT_664996 [Crucibulum laeve]
MFSSLLAAFTLAAAAVASPIESRASCDTASAKLVLPAGQTALTGQLNPASFVLLGVGVQNYTCSSAGTYASAGAVAELFDISCLSKTKPAFDSVQDIAYGLWKAAPASLTTTRVSTLLSSMKLATAGQHYFVTSPSGTGISPVWDARATSPLKGNPDAFVLAAKVANIVAPTGAKDIDWLQLKSVQGGLATQIYRTDTRGGPAPATCTPGSPPISVKYTSKYWLFGSSVKV